MQNLTQAIENAKNKGFVPVKRISNKAEVHAFTKCRCNKAHGWQKAYWFSSKASWALWCPRCGSHFPTEAELAFEKGLPKKNPIKGGMTLKRWIKLRTNTKSVVVE